MPTDLSILQEDGYSPEKLKAIFEQDWEKKPDKIQNLIKRHQGRIQRGVTRCLEDSQYYRALDDAFDLGQRQVTITQMRRLVNTKGVSQQEVMSAANDWGLSDMLVDLLDRDGRPIIDSSDPTGTRNIKRLDLPIFFNVFIPLAMAYVKVRAAFLFNERDIWPPYKYEPQHLTLRGRVETELVTARVTRMHQEMDYRSIDRQSILSILQYGLCMNFPLEPFYRETVAVKVDGKRENKVVREGVRYDIPHPTKTFYDEAWPLSTLNSDIGCSYVGHWRMQRYDDLMRTDIWNKDKIQIGPNSWSTSSKLKNYLAELYPCAVRMPAPVKSDTNTSGREENAFTYSNTDGDMAVGTTVLFEKLNPKEDGLYDHDGMVWHRFIYGGDRTVLSCEPFAYAPGPVFLYDYDSNRWRNSSLLGELLPHQDHISNLFTQYIIQVKQNLERVVFWNVGALKEDEIKRIQNLGQQRYASTKWIPFDPRELGHAQTRINEAFFTPNLGGADTTTTLNAIMASISLLERTLGFSAQEIGAPSEYKPSATEVSVRVGASNTRLNYTGSFIDDAIHARKRRLYEAIVAYSTDDIFATVADLTETDKKSLKEAGFEVEDGPGARAGIRVKPSKLSMDSFVAQREGKSRSTDSSIATSMINIFQMLFASPDIIQRVGVKNLMNRFNDVLNWAGVPKDWRFDDADLTGNPEEDAKVAQEQMASMQEQLAPAVNQIIKPVVDAIAGRLDQQEQATANGILQVAQQSEQGQAQLAGQLDQRLVQLEQAIGMQLGELRKQIEAGQVVQQVPVPVVA